MASGKMCNYCGVIGSGLVLGYISGLLIALALGYAIGQSKVDPPQPKRISVTNWTTHREWFDVNDPDINAKLAASHIQSWENGAAFTWNCMRQNPGLTFDEIIQAAREARDR